MLLYYRILTIFFLIISPLLLFYRIVNKKEDPERCLEKFGRYSKSRIKGKIIWFHGSSVGEVMSVLPLVEKLEKRKDIKQILITSNTYSSSKILSKFKLKKTIHQFFPLDVSFIIKKFLKHWKPSIAIFIESEIWPNAIIEIKKEKIPLILINARITKKSFGKWVKIKSFSRFLFEKFDLCMPQNKETIKYLKVLGTKNINKIGNLKFSESKEAKKKELNPNLQKYFKKKNIILGAISTHYSEELICAKVHMYQKKILKNLITLIIPRHVHRSKEIVEDLKKYNLNIHLHSSKKIPKRNIDIYLVDTFGETKLFTRNCSIVFLGGSLINHGGQNPLEAARAGCKILHGPYIENFKDVYSFLSKFRISKKVTNLTQLKHEVIENLKTKSMPKKNILKIKKIGKEILRKNYNQISNYL